MFKLFLFWKPPVMPYENLMIKTFETKMKHIKVATTKKTNNRLTNNC